MKKNTKLSEIIEIQRIIDEGFIYIAEEGTHIPFPIRRVYYISDADIHSQRGFHAHRRTRQILFCIRGTIKVMLDNGHEREEIVLEKPNEGLLLNTMIWHEMVNFQKDTLLLIMASDPYDESDYIRDYQDFLTQTSTVLK